MPDILIYALLAVGLILSSIVGGVVYRWRGGGEPVGWGRYMPRPVDQILFSLPYIAIAYAVLSPWQAGILSFVTVVMIMKGHGRNMDLGTFDNNSRPGGVSPEWYEGVIEGLYGKIPEYWYDALGLAISGLTYTIPLGLFIADPANDLFGLGIVLAASGALKAPAYMLGKALADFLGDDIEEEYANRLREAVRFDGFTSYGEYFTGAFMWPVAFYVLYKLWDLGFFNEIPLN